MAIPVWPTDLPQYTLMQGYSESYPNNLLMSEGDTGVGKVRRKGATPPFAFTRSFYLSKDQRNILANFVQFTLKDGALRFGFVHPVDGNLIEMRIMPVSADDLYTTSREGKVFFVTLRIKVLP